MVGQGNARKGASSALVDSKKPIEWKPVFVMCKSCLWYASELVSSNDRCPSYAGVLYKEKLDVEVTRHNGYLL